MTKRDQYQDQKGNGAGFGEFAAARYRGMGFTPTLPILTAIGFIRNKGSQGIKIYIDTADSNSIPTNAVGSELYSFTITNARINSQNAFQLYPLPVPLEVTPGSQYCFYIAPWNTSTDAYQDDYQDAQWIASNPYSGGKPIINSAGTWSVSDSGNLDMFFETWGRDKASGLYVPAIRPRLFRPGLAR